MGDYKQLIIEIATCPTVTAIQSGKSDQTHPCHSIVTSQDPSSFQLPEPWSGQLDIAPILFISSNPSINDRERYPDRSWPLDQTKDFFHNRFSPGAPWVRNGLYTLQRDGSYGEDWVRFWASARSRACEILGAKKSAARSGIDFALTEVVHCKSRGELGVESAQPFCSRQYLGRILMVSPARVLVVFGGPAKKAITDYLGAEMKPVTNHPRFAMTSNQRLLAFLPHPNERGSLKSCKDNLGEDGLLLLRKQLNR